MSLNKVMLIGNVGKDPEVRYLDGNGQNGQGNKVATFPLATTERYRDRNGESKENTEWHNIVAFRQPADVIERFVKKGTQLYIEGKLRTRSYNDATGAKKYTTEILVDNLQLLGKREGDQGGYPAPQPQQPVYQQPQQPAYQQPAYQQPVYQAPQPAYQAPRPAAPAAPVAPAAPAAPAQAQPIDLGFDGGSDDLPF